MKGTKVRGSPRGTGSSVGRGRRRSSHLAAGHGVQADLRRCPRTPVGPSERRALGAGALGGREDAQRPDLVVAGPASFRSLNPGPSHFYSRHVDRAAKRLIKRWVAEGRVESKAIGVADAASCPHNLLTQAALGLPVGGPTPPWRLLGTRDALPSRGHWLVEVHPAVALGVWWKGPGAMARYKPGGGKRVSEVRVARRTLIEQLQRTRGFPAGEAQEFSDDHVDAWTAWHLATMLLQGSAHRWGPRDGAYYLMPSARAWAP